VFIHNEIHRGKAIRIIKKVKDACLIAHSIKSKITMEITVEIKPILIEAK
jgi:uncharacterized OsmC-like protein